MDQRTNGTKLVTSWAPVGAKKENNRQIWKQKLTLCCGKMLNVDVCHWNIFVILITVLSWPPSQISITRSVIFFIWIECEINLPDFNNFNQQHIAELLCVVTAPFCYGLYSYCVQLFKNWRETEKVSLTMRRWRSCTFNSSDSVRFSAKDEQTGMMNTKTSQKHINNFTILWTQISHSKLGYLCTFVHFLSAYILLSVIFSHLGNLEQHSSQLNTTCQHLINIKPPQTWGLCLLSWFVDNLGEEESEGRDGPWGKCKSVNIYNINSSGDQFSLLLPFIVLNFRFYLWYLVVSLLILQMAIFILML